MKTIIALLTLSSFASADTSVCFSPKGGCAAQAISEIAKANKTIRVQAYSFTSSAIAGALIAAHARGVDVQVLLDKSNVRDARSQRIDLQHAGIAVLIDAAHAISHNKVIVVDDQTVIGGSYNYSNQAERYNAENMTIMHDHAMAIIFLANWNVHRGHSHVVQ